MTTRKSWHVWDNSRGVSNDFHIISVDKVSIVTCSQVRTQLTRRHPAESPFPAAESAPLLVSSTTSAGAPLAYLASFALFAAVS